MSKSAERFTLHTAVLRAFPKDETRVNLTPLSPHPTEWFAYGPPLVPEVRMGPATRYWDGYRWRPAVRIRSEAVSNCWGKACAGRPLDTEGWLRAQYLRGPELEFLLERGLARCVRAVTAVVAPEGVCLALNAPVRGSVLRALGLEEAMAAVRSMMSAAEVHSG